RLPGGIIGTVDVLYTRAVHQWYVSDANLGPPVGAAQGEGNRPLYGAISAAGFASPVRPAPALGAVVRVSDGSGDHSVVLSGQLRKQFGDRAELSALYAHTRAWDRMSLVNFQALPNLQNTPLDGTLEDRRLRPSFFEIPERVELGALVRLPYRMEVSLLYAGASGTPFTYVVQGDANADGSGSSGMSNDIVYVPRDSSDIALAAPADWGARSLSIAASGTPPDPGPRVALADGAQRQVRLLGADPDDGLVTVSGLRATTTRLWKLEVRVLPPQLDLLGQRMSRSGQRKPGMT